MGLSKTILDNWEYNLNFVLDSTYNGAIAADKSGYLHYLAHLFHPKFGAVLEMS